MMALGHFASSFLDRIGFPELREYVYVASTFRVDATVIACYYKVRIAWIFLLPEKLLLCRVRKILPFA